MNFVIESYSYTFSHTFRSTYILTTRFAAVPACPPFEIWSVLSYLADFLKDITIPLFLSMYLCMYNNAGLMSFYSSKLKKKQRNIESNHWEVAKSFPSLVTLNSAKSQVRLSSVPCHLNNPMSQ